MGKSSVSDGCEAVSALSPDRATGTAGGFRRFGGGGGVLLGFALNVDDEDDESNDTGESGSVGDCGSPGPPRGGTLRTGCSVGSSTSTVVSGRI